MLSLVGCKTFNSAKRNKTMALTYENMKEFMIKYCKDYSLYGNDAETMPKMDKYWAPNFKSTAYFHLMDGTYPVIHKSRKEFQDFLIHGHINIKDALIPQDIIVDEKEKKVVIQLRIEKENRKTGEISKIDGIGIYQLIVDKNNSPKITSLDFYWDIPNKINHEYD
jgi:hypothetical protein